MFRPSTGWNVAGRALVAWMDQSLTYLGGGFYRRRCENSNQRAQAFFMRPTLQGRLVKTAMPVAGPSPFTLVPSAAWPRRGRHLCGCFTGRQSVDRRARPADSRSSMTANRLTSVKVEHWFPTAASGLRNAWLGGKGTGGGRRFRSLRLEWRIGLSVGWKWQTTHDSDSVFPGTRT